MSATQASAAETIQVFPGKDVVTVIERFSVSPAEQPEVVERAAHHISQAWKGRAGFVAATLLRGRERGGVTCYSQWRPVDDAAPAEVPDAWSLAAALPTTTSLDARTYTVDFSDSATPPTQVSLGGTPFVHFGIFSVAPHDQERLLELARANAPKSLQVTPGLVSINFHRSLDGSQVINLGTWTTFDHIGLLLQQPGFKDNSLYWSGVAEFQPDFFDVVLLEVAGTQLSGALAI